jgi:hypothetical protein
MKVVFFLEASPQPLIKISGVAVVSLKDTASLITDDNDKTVLSQQASRHKPVDCFVFSLRETQAD